jgi:hypothetical protein
MPAQANGLGYRSGTATKSPNGQRCEAFWRLKNWGFAILGGMKKGQIPNWY